MTEPPFRLLLVRHAKAGEAPVDVERPLTDRGRRDARALGRWLSDQRLLPVLAAVSPAVRAQETWQYAVAELGDPPPTVIERGIYQNTPDALLIVIRETPDAVQSLAVVGHNPGLERLARDLDDGTGDTAARAALAVGLPTGSVAVFSLADPFSELTDAGATLTALYTARG